MCRVRIPMNEEKTVWQTYKILECLSEDTFFWHFSLKNEETGNIAPWAFPKRTTVKEYFDKVTGKLRGVIKHNGPPSFLDKLRNKAIMQGKFQPFEEDIPPIEREPGEDDF